jgi:hypothetical protein
VDNHLTVTANVVQAALEKLAILLELFSGMVAVAVVVNTVLQIQVLSVVLVVEEWAAETASMFPALRALAVVVDAVTILDLLVA